jgi:hypothetical protein
MPRAFDSRERQPLVPPHAARVLAIHLPRPELRVPEAGLAGPVEAERHVEVAGPVAGHVVLADVQKYL